MAPRRLPPPDAIVEHADVVDLSRLINQDLQRAAHSRRCVPAGRGCRERARRTRPGRCLRRRNSDRSRVTPVVLNAPVISGEPPIWHSMSKEEIVSRPAQPTVTDGKLGLLGCRASDRQQHSRDR